LLKAYNVFNYNDGCMALVPGHAADHPPELLITRSRSGSAGIESGMSGLLSTSPTHNHHTFMDELVGAAGHGLLNGKVRKTQLYPGMSVSDASDGKLKKGI
jgi:hypothetical protein